jgi:exopolysaccharide biosynthesis polyprenyl glycosylphosphotransferase
MVQYILTTMPVKTVRFYTLALVIFDVLAILSAFVLAYVLRVQLDARPLVNQIGALDFFLTFLQLTPFWIITLLSLGLYSPAVYQKRLTEIGKLLMASFVGVLLIIGYDFIVTQPIFPARLVPLYAGIATFLFLVLGREVLRLVRDLAYYFGYGVQRVMVIGQGEATKDIIENLGNTSRSGYRVVATVGTRVKGDYAYFKVVENALENLKKLKVDTIIQTDLYPESERNQHIMGAAQEHHISYSFIPGEAEFYSGKNQIDVFLGYPIIAVHQTPLVGWGELVKRIFDVFATVITLPVWGGLIVLVAILQKIFNPGPVLYRSARLTRYSKHFSLLKFRSMAPQYGKKDAADEFREMGRLDLAKEYEKYRKVENDPRITKFGRFIRATSLDELPQLINVLKGDLSLVGPRPILPPELRLYLGRGSLLHSVKSGLTGLWQVSGRSDLSFEKRVELELYYAQNWSFWLDIKILFKTIKVVLFGSGAK